MGMAAAAAADARDLARAPELCFIIISFDMGESPSGWVTINLISLPPLTKPEVWLALAECMDRDGWIPFCSSRALSACSMICRTAFFKLLALDIKASRWLNLALCIASGNKCNFYSGMVFFLFFFN
jgi:hypothetical protein